MAVVDRRLYKEIGTRLYNLRLQKGYSRQYIADQLQISAKFLYEIENGRKGFTVQVLFHLAEIFGKSCDYLITGKEPEVPQQEKPAEPAEPESCIQKVLKLFNVEELDKIAIVLRAVYAVKDQEAKNQEPKEDDADK